MEEGRKVLVIACDLIRRHVPPMIMQAALQLCARLTKSHALAVQFLESGGLVALFGLPRSCFFPGYDTLASAIVRHLLEDPQTLQTAMELEIRQTLSGSRHGGRISARTFLTSMAPVISRDPGVFMRAVAAVCQLESSGGRCIIMLSKDKDKEKEKLKASGIDTGISTNECIRITESKAHDGSIKYSKVHKKVSANLTQVIDYLLEIVSTYPSHNGEDDCTSHPSAMDVDEPTNKMKGKSKLLSDILLMYVHVVGVILRRDLEMCQLRGSSHFECPGQGGIVHHVLRLLPLSIDKSAGPDEWRDKLSEKASWFLVVLAGRSSEGRRRVVNELVKALSSFINVEGNSSISSLLPDKKGLAFVDLVYSILSKNSSSNNLPGSGCSPDIAKSMIDGGIVHCLSGILQVEGLMHSLLALLLLKNHNLLITEAVKMGLLAILAGSAAPDISQNDDDHNANQNQSAEQEMRIEEDPTTDTPVDLGVDYMREDMEESGAVPNTEQIEMGFHVENRVDDDMNEEEDDMDVEDHDDAGLGDEYNDDMVDEEDDDFHENRVIEVRWREALDGLDHLQVLGQPGTGGGLIDVSAEAFEGVNVDDFFGIRRSFGFERRRQANRTSYERSVTEGNGLQHPLLLRPSNSGDLVSIWSSAGNSSRDSEGISAGNLDVAHFYMFDAPVLPYDNAPTNLFGDRLGGSVPTQLGDFSVGLESLRGSGRRGLGDGRWTDDGQPQGGGHAAAIAQAVEEQFISQLSNNVPAERLSQNPGLGKTGRRSHFGNR
ncbi:UNVERIFIED_CONTAM: E3 ubiquitin-protein ligase UPL2 [Sesamum radiatum]|uniref:E3 ubiquitin-protein ligase UPL2 n=1 Tax=Sesamum radiatum TaxID=300843 RepID=A0AAW2KJA6_SESRA